MEEAARYPQATLAFFPDRPDWLAIHPFSLRPQGPSREARHDIHDWLGSLRRVDNDSVLDVAVPTMRKTVARELALARGTAEYAPEAPLSSLRFGIAPIIVMSATLPAAPTVRW